MGNLAFSEETLAFGLTPLAGKPWKVVSCLSGVTHENM